MRILPTFQGYTIDYRLAEFRRAVSRGELTCIGFGSKERRRILHEVRQDPSFVIREETGDRDAWVCVCGNQPATEGFYPCNQSGEQVEPTAELWPESLYVCARCGRIIDADTLAVVSLESNVLARVSVY